MGGVWSPGSGVRSGGVPVQETEKAQARWSVSGVSEAVECSDMRMLPVVGSGSCFWHDFVEKHWTADVVENARVSDESCTMHLCFGARRRSRVLNE